MNETDMAMTDVIMSAPTPVVFPLGNGWAFGRKERENR